MGCVDFVHGQIIIDEDAESITEEVAHVGILGQVSSLKNANGKLLTFNDCMKLSMFAPCSRFHRSSNGHSAGPGCTAVV